MNPIVEQAKPFLLDFVKKSKTNFLTQFGDWVHSIHLAELEDIFLVCGEAKIEMWAETDPAKLSDWQDIYETALARLDTIGLQVKIIGTVDARQFLRNELTTILSYVPMVAGIIVKVAMPLVLPGIGGVIATPLGAGVEYFLDKVMGVK